MKKSFLILFAFVGMLLVSCSSIDSQISQYENACQAGDMARAERIAAKLSKHTNEITDEQAYRIAAASEKLAESAVRSMSEESFDVEEDAE